VLPDGHTIRAQHQTIRLNRDSIVVFVDDAPEMNWGHPCRYVLVNDPGPDVYRQIHEELVPRAEKTARKFSKRAEAIDRELSAQLKKIVSQVMCR